VWATYILLFVVFSGWVQYIDILVIEAANIVDIQQGKQLISIVVQVKFVPHFIIKQYLLPGF
jgi:hypothetical protein